MYCPRCAARLSASASRCHECGLDVQPIAQMLHRPTPNLTQRWKQQRQGWGKLLIMCSLLVGCLIPIGIGVFRESIHLSSIVVVLAGLAGILLILGSMLLMAANNEILTTDHDHAADHAAQEDHTRSYVRS